MLGVKYLCYIFVGSHKWDDHIYEIMYLFFDVETNGLPKRYNAPIDDVDNWPRVVQIAFSRYSEDGDEVSSYGAIVYPDDFEIPQETVDVHGITKERALNEGISGNEVFTAFTNEALKSKYLVAHNFDFDYPTVSAEIVRYGLKNEINGKESICTMKPRAVKEFCALPGRFGDYKWPKLTELHEKLFGEPFEDAHDALVDVNACARCFFELKKRGIL